jgi:4-amino-4-deoxy-L-arabinose transferase-like glycosyltransferase
MGASPQVSSDKWLLPLLAAWVLLGLFGRDPWKPDEAYSFGLVYHVLQTGDWIVPTLGGEPFMEKPPLFYVTAALFAKLFGWLLPLHDAARLANALYVGLTLWAVARAARSPAAALWLAACLGYVHHAHLLITDNSLMAGMAIALYGFSVIAESPRKGGLLLGTGAGMAFMSKGLLGPGLLGITAFALLAFPAWRSRDYFKSWGWAALAVAPWLVLWPLALWLKAPAMFDEWLWVQNFGRFTGEHKIGGVPDHWHYVKALPWFAFPAWPLAMWFLVERKHALKGDASLQLPLTAFVVMFAVLSGASLARQIYALPMLLPLCMLAARVEAPPAWLRWPLDKLALWGGAAVGIALWAFWAWSLQGLTGRLAAEAPGFVPRVQPLWLVLGLAVTALWFLVARRGDLATRFAAASLLAWGLAMTLWLPLLDYAKTYRGVIAEMQKRRPAGCVATHDLSEPQRAVFHYFAGIRKREQDRDCPLLLVHTSSRTPPVKGGDWTLLWDGGRPGDEREHFWLYERSLRRQLSAR